MGAIGGSVRPMLPRHRRPWWGSVASLLLGCALQHPSAGTAPDDAAALDLPTPPDDTSLGRDASSPDLPATDAGRDVTAPGDSGTPDATDTGALPPTDLPTDIPTDIPIDIPMDIPTDIPTDTRRDVPVDVPVDTGACGASSQPCCAGAAPCATGLTCFSGRCVPPCPGAFALCEGVCRDVANDPAHCGGCRLACGTAGTNAARCVGGACVLACAPGVGDCDGNGVNGCEQPLDTAFHCGACGVRCPPPPPGSHQFAECATPPRCAVRCAPNWGNCNGLPMDGCERPLNNVANCGACDHRCTAGQACIPGIGAEPFFCR